MAAAAPFLSFPSPPELAGAFFLLLALFKKPFWNMLSPELLALALPFFFAGLPAAPACADASRAVTSSEIMVFNISKSGWSPNLSNGPINKVRPRECLY